MARFVVQHRHPAEACPARDPVMAPMLLQHLSPANAAKYGVVVQGEGVVDGGHTLYLVVEAPDRDHVDRFMVPFARAGDVEVLPASSCEAVVGRGTC